jgi:hypothetical protein
MLVTSNVSRLLLLASDLGGLLATLGTIGALIAVARGRRSIIAIKPLVVCGKDDTRAILL